jgi:hypothetical protein
MSGIVEEWPAEYQHFIALLAETIEEYILNQPGDAGDAALDLAGGGDDAPAGDDGDIGVEEMDAPCEVPG